MRDVLDPRLDLHPGGSRRSLVVGLVNNMSPGALKATEGQFARLLRAACPQLAITLELFSVHPAGAPAAYRPMQELFEARLDAVIVTGMEPQAGQLEDEPAWDCLTRIVDWTQERAIPSIWSCLAAHAAVLHLDGIRRSRLPAKLSGVFGCELVSFDHVLAAELPKRWSVPHSRYNGLSEAALVTAGYEILSHSEAAGVDGFMRGGSAPFLFFQGHPEYDTGSLPGEYTRDVRRYLCGQRDEYPRAPANFFAAPLEAALDDCRRNILHGGRDPSALREVQRLVAGATTPNSWQRPAIRLYANWIERQVLRMPDQHPGMFAAGLLDGRRPEPALAGEF
nr:homoserine O-succinyltransferase [uncultured Lichenicoccus sp.]